MDEVEPSYSVPDYVEPLTGWRVWLVVREEGPLRLRSVLYYDLWLPGRERVAECQGVERDLMRPWRRKTHAAPSERCECGIYASWDLREAVDYLQGFHRPGGEVVSRVIGLVALWGTVVECERGWRASHAYPERIYVPKPHAGEGALPAEELAFGLTEYGVPVEILDCEDGEALVAALGAVAGTAAPAPSPGALARARPPGESRRRGGEWSGGIAVAAAVALVLGAAFSYQFNTGDRAFTRQRAGLAAVPDRPFTAAEKRAIEAELRSALEARRQSRYGTFWTHARRAQRLAAAHGDSLLLAHLSSLFFPGRYQAFAEFHVSRALSILRRSPTAVESPGRPRERLR